MKRVMKACNSSELRAINPLTWPFVLATLAYGLGFTFFYWAGEVKKSSLFMSMTETYDYAAPIWGASALAVIVIVVAFLVFKHPRIGKFASVAGFMLWLYAAFSWFLVGADLLVFAVALPNAWFWFWQYLCLARKKPGETLEDTEPSLSEYLDEMSQDEERA